jgi:hypothetical protein
MGGALRIVVLGIIGRCPFAGVAWQAMQYLEGFRRLGHDVYYVEETWGWTLDMDHQNVTDDCSYTLRYLSRVMEWLGFGERWALRRAAENRQVYGLPEARLDDLLATADMVVNVCGATLLQDQYLQVPVRVYLETDPGPEVQIALGDEFATDFLKAHTHHYTYAERLGFTDCALPVTEFRLRPTRQPIIMDWWASNGAAAPSSACFRTVSSWVQTGRDLEWNGQCYTWSKHHQFLKFIDIPKHLQTTLEIALASRDPDVVQMLESHGWIVSDALELTKDILPYRDYVLSSRGEFTVAKDLYTRPRTGWFSDRSASYLAAGRPVITQDTGFGDIFPTRRGLFAFNTCDDIIEAVQAIESDYEGHCHAARDIANGYFRAEKVLSDLIAAL